MEIERIDFVHRWRNLCGQSLVLHLRDSDGCRSGTGLWLERRADAVEGNGAELHGIGDFGDLALVSLRLIQNGKRFEIRLP